MPFSSSDDYSNFQGPSPEEEFRAFRNNRGRECDDGIQGSGGLRHNTPRHGKYSHQQVGNIRVK